MLAILNTTSSEGEYLPRNVMWPKCACIEDPVVIRKILNHLQEKSPLDSGVQIANPRWPPQASLFG
jgi:hypothetical protein